MPLEDENLYICLYLQGRQGIVRKIYRGTIFLYDENETENGGYFCAKSQMCEKIVLSADACKEKVVSLKKQPWFLFLQLFFGGVG